MVVRWVGGFCVLKNFHADQKWVARKETERCVHQPTTIIEARFPSSCMPRGHSLEFGAPDKRHLVEDVGTASSGRALRKTSVPRRFCSTSSSSSSSSSSKHDGAVESDGSEDDEPDEAAFDESFAVRDVYDTRLLARRLQRRPALHTTRLARGEQEDEC